ncbi:MAG: biopolymer transporter ExbD [Verrucomicrobiota bacterium]
MQIAPLLDVLFVLLLFFMVNAGIQQKEAELNITLPGTGAGQLSGAPKTPIRLGVLASGQILWEDAPIGAPEDQKLGALVAKLTDLIKYHDDQPIIIAPEAEAQHQRVIDVLSAADRANVKNLAFGSYRR